MKSLVTKKTVAAKIIEKSILVHDTSNELISSVKHEIEVLRRIEHPNLLNLVEIHESKNQIILITEIIQGPKIQVLHSLGKPLPEIQLLKICKDVLLAL